MATIILNGPVGKGYTDNSEDAKTVRNRLKSLGFFPGTNDSDLIKAIELFQAICKGYTKLTPQGNGVDGKISLYGFTHKWLAAHNAPGWKKFYAAKGEGWQSTVDGASYTGTAYTEINGGYGTTWVADVIKNAAHAYAKSAKPDYPPMWVRDCAPKKGGKATGHGSHQTGLDIDLRLPLNPEPVGSLNSANPDEMIFQFNGQPNLSWTYLKKQKQRKLDLYLDAVEAQLEALVAQPRVEKIFYQDDISEGKKIHTQWVKVRPIKDPPHKDHMHIRITPPIRLEGVIKNVHTAK